MNGTASLDSNPANQEENMKSLFDTIIGTYSSAIDNSEEPLQFQVALLDYNDYVGRIELVAYSAVQ